MPTGKRELDTATLDEFARCCAVHFPQESRYSKKNPKVALYGREWVMQCLFNLHFRDEFDHVVAAIRNGINSGDEIKPLLAAEKLAEFEAEAAKRFTPRSDKVLAEELALRLAITPDGKHIPGRIGNVLIGSRPVATRIAMYEKKGSMRRRLEAFEAGETPPVPEIISFTRRADWPIYAGEDEERALSGGGAADPLPDPSTVCRGDEHMQPVTEG